VVSVMNNIAEGFDRKSNNEFKQFLFIAKGSYKEVNSMLILSNELKIVDSEKMDNLLTLSEEISRMIFGLKRFNLFGYNSPPLAAIMKNVSGKIPRCLRRGSSLLMNICLLIP